MGKKTRRIAVFGDFQTPLALAQAATQALVDLGLRPSFIVEPSCGTGAFVCAAATHFPHAQRIIGVDVNAAHLNEARRRVPKTQRIELLHGNFFSFDWEKLIGEAPDPVLVIGNPPWVTSSALGVLDGDNLPEKSNFQGRAGIDAITGKSNFDICEWMLLRYLAWLENRAGAIAVLCKTSVARKILASMWGRRYPFRSAHIYRIDALAEFRAATDACFFVVFTQPDAHAESCDVFSSFDARRAESVIGFREGRVISDLDAFESGRRLLGANKHYVWRSGIKHDCAKVMELSAPGPEAPPGHYTNGLGETVEIEAAYVYPLLKSSDIGAHGLRNKSMLVPQRQVGEDTAGLADTAPKTWAYLQTHVERLQKRASVIYRNKPPFSIFGVGAYSFTPWKVAISGFYKQLSFSVVGPLDGRPVVFDDTVYFLPCDSEAEALFLQELLNSQPARALLSAMIHWADKRPITSDLLRRISLEKLAKELGREEDFARFAGVERSPI